MFRSRVVPRRVGENLRSTQEYEEGVGGGGGSESGNGGGGFKHFFEQNKTMVIVFIVIFMLIIILGGYFLYKKFSTSKDDTKSVALKELKKPAVSPVSETPKHMMLSTAIVPTHHAPAPTTPTIQKDEDKTIKKDDGETKKDGEKINPTVDLPPMTVSANNLKKTNDIVALYTDKNNTIVSVLQKSNSTFDVCFTATQLLMVQNKPQSFIFKRINSQAISTNYLSGDAHIPKHVKGATRVKYDTTNGLIEHASERYKSWMVYKLQRNPDYDSDLALQPNITPPLSEIEKINMPVLPAIGIMMLSNIFEHYVRSTIRLVSNIQTNTNGSLEYAHLICMENDSAKYINTCAYVLHIKKNGFNDIADWAKTFVELVRNNSEKEALEGVIVINLMVVCDKDWDNVADPTKKPTTPFFTLVKNAIVAADTNTAFQITFANQRRTDQEITVKNVQYNIVDFMMVRTNPTFIKSDLTTPAAITSYIDESSTAFEHVRIEEVQQPHHMDMDYRHIYGEMSVRDHLSSSVISESAD